MDNITSLDAVSALLSGMPFLQYLLDLLLKSSLIIGASFLIAMLFHRRISNNGAHLLWLNSMLCVALLPLSMAVFSSLPATFLGNGPVSVITVDSSAAVSVEAASRGGHLLLVIIYAAVSALLLLRLLFSGIALKRIDSDAQGNEDESTSEQLRRLRETLDIARTVSVKFSEDIASPMSFGLFRPVVILPSAASSWSECTLEDVLLHELSHIKRLDWVSMLFCHLLTSLFWVNPLVWIAKSRVDAAAEQACDSAVLRYGKDGIDYAEELLRLARESQTNRRAPILAQLMFDQGSLTLRIRNILDGGLSGKMSRTFIGTMLVTMVLVLSACSSINLFGSKKYDGEILPTKAEPPLYPTRAAQRGIEGWVLVAFTVTEKGLVAENSVEVVDAEPRGIFDRSAARAAARFEFEPPLRYGKPVDIEGVQYVFRFNLEDGDYQPEGHRPPPRARSRQD